jgi:hypothetical protein
MCTAAGTADASFSAKEKIKLIKFSTNQILTFRPNLSTATLPNPNEKLLSKSSKRENLNA